MPCNRCARSSARLRSVDVAVRCVSRDRLRQELVIAFDVRDRAHAVRETTSRLVSGSRDVFVFVLGIDERLDFGRRAGAFSSASDSVVARRRVLRVDDRRSTSRPARPPSCSCRAPSRARRRVACRTARTLPKCLSRRWRRVAPMPGMSSSSRAQARLAAAIAMERVREPVRLVADAREHVELGRVRAQRDRVLHVAAVDAIGRAAGFELALLREADHLDAVLAAELARRGRSAR